MKSKKPIVILGGMGPQASSKLYRTLIDKASCQYGVTENEDYPHIIVQSLPVPDFISSRKYQNEAILRMQQAVKFTRMAKPIAVGMACNTAHLFVEEIEIKDGLPFVSLIEVVAKAVQSMGLKKVGLLASPTTIATGLYRDSLNRVGVELVVPNKTDQKRIEAVIRAVIAGLAGTKEAVELRDITRGLIDKGSEGIILGCTELPLAFNRAFVDSPVFDCLDLLADELLSLYYREYAILGQR